jgi:hypothetical protein
MEWFLKKGQDLSTSKSAHTKVAFYQDFLPGIKRKTSVQLLASNDDVAPAKSTDQVDNLPFMNERHMLTCPVYLYCHHVVRRPLRRA